MEIEIKPNKIIDDKRGGICADFKLIKNKMKIIPFRIKPSKEEDDFSEIYEFLIKGSSKDAYVVEIFIDDANDLGITFETCTCPHFKFRGEVCKHIKHCKELLEEFEVISAENINKASREVEDE